MECSPPQRPQQSRDRDSLLAFLKEYGHAAPVEYNGRRAQSASELFSHAARKQKFTMSQVHRTYHVIMDGRRLIGGFGTNQTSLSSDDADRASLSKPAVRNLLHRAGVPIPKGRAFLPDARDEAAAWFSSLGGPAVVKPIYSRAAADISLSIHTPERFHDAWHAAVTRRARTDDSDSSVVVERQLAGIDIRVFVVGEEVVAAAARVPLFCFGDGRHTLRERIESVSQQREQHPLLSRFPHDALAHALTAKLAVDSTSADGRLYLLAEHGNMQHGGVTVDLTDHLNEGLRNLAIDAAWAVPGCRAAGIDLLVPNVNKADGAVVLDVDVRSSMTLHHYPFIGTRRRVAESLVKQMSQTSRN